MRRFETTLTTGIGFLGDRRSRALVALIAAVIAAFLGIAEALAGRWG